MNSREPDKENDTSLRRTGQVYLLFLLSLLLLVTLGAITQMQFPLFGLGFTELFLILLPAIIFVRSKRLPIAKALGWKRISPSTAFISIAVGTTCWGVAAGMFVLSQLILGEQPVVEALIPRTLPDLFWILIFAALLPGLCEESLFRGVIQGVLGRKGKRAGLVITALLFALFHVSPWILVPGFFLGIVFGILAIRTGSTVPAIIAHIANNTTAFTVSYFYYDRPESEAYMLMGGLAAACCVAFPLFWIMTRGLKTAQPLLEAVPAGVRRPGAWLLGLAGGTVLLGVLSFGLAVLMLVGLHSVNDDTLEPEFRSGDQLILFKGGFVELDLEVGDVISYERDGITILRKIARLDEDSVWIRDGNDEVLVPRKEITAKVVHVIKTSGLSKR